MADKLDGCGWYFSEIGKFPLLTRQEEIAYHSLMHTGSESESAYARNVLIRSNLLFVVFVAQEFRGSALPLMDRISEGNIGLMTAVDKFSPEKGARLTTYAVNWIRRAIRLAVANERLIHMTPESTINSAKVRCAVSACETAGKSPDAGEISRMTGMSEKSVKYHLERLHSTVHLSDYVFPDGNSDARVEDFLDDNNACFSSGFFDGIEGLLSCLKEREKSVVEMYLGLNGSEPMIFDDIGAEIGRTRERARQIWRGAVRKMRVYANGTAITQNI